MTLLSRLTGAKAVTDANDTQRSVPFVDSLSSYRTATGEYIGVTSALRIVTVYACVRVLAETVASLPLSLYRKHSDGGREEYTDHPLYETLHYQPNPEMTSFVWRETLMNHLTTWGNAYCEIARDGVGRMTLWPLRPDRMEVYYDSAGRRAYDYIDNTGTRKTLKPGTVFHIPGLSSNGLKGYSPIALHRDALGLYKAAESFGSNLFRNNARPAVVLQHPRNLTPAAVERLATQMDQLKGSANSGKTVILEEGLELKEIGIPPEDAQYIETRKFQMQEIARMFRVPPHMIGDLERATFSNIEHQSIDFVNHTINPWVQRIRQEIKAQLLYGEPDVSVDFRTDDLKQGDALSVVQALSVERNAGVITANEWRAVRKRNPIEGGNEDFWKPLNVDTGGEKSESATPNKEDADTLISLVSAGLMTHDEARAIMHKPPIEWSDDLSGEETANLLEQVKAGLITHDEARAFLKLPPMSWSDDLTPDEITSLIERVNAGLLTHDEARKLMKLPPIEWSDDLSDTEKADLIEQVKAGLITHDEARGFLKLPPMTWSEDLTPDERNTLMEEVKAGLRTPQEARELMKLPPIDWSTSVSAEEVAQAAALIRAGFEPADVLRALGLPPIRHTGLPPVTVQKVADAEGIEPVNVEAA